MSKKNVVTIDFLYRCRRCKVEYTESTLGGTKTGAVLLALETFNPKYPPDLHAPEMFTLHYCGGNTHIDYCEHGVADFIGYNTTPEGFKR